MHFVWHSRGKFLVRWSNKDRAYIFQSIPDLNSIRVIYINRHSLIVNQNDLAKVQTLTDNTENTITNSSTCINKWLVCDNTEDTNNDDTFKADFLNATSLKAHIN